MLCFPFKTLRNSTIFFAVLAAFLNPCLAQESAVVRTHLEFYSESVKADDTTSTGLLSETRLRLFPTKILRAKPYLGVFKNSFQQGPNIGSTFRLHPTFSIDAMIEQRWLYSDQQNGQPETRWGLIGGDWRELTTNWNNESYGEIILIPRLSNTPISTGWSRLFYRATLRPAVVLDPYVQIWARRSPLNDLGTSGLEFRPGIRLAWNPPDSHLGLHIYQRAKLVPQNASELEAMLVIWSELK